MKQWLYRFLALLTQKHQPPSDSLPTVYLPQVVIEATAQLITSFGTPGEYHEGIAYWAGIPMGQVWVITTVFSPEAVTTPGSFKTNALANAQVVTKVNKFRLQLLAQIHGHPTDWVDHSAGDNTGAFMPYHGFYSVVVPYYGERGLLPLCSCGIHRYESNQFRRLTLNQIDQQFIVVPTMVDLRRQK